MVAGGAAPLELPGRPCSLALDSPVRTVPAYCAVAAASAAQLEACRTHPADWTYLSPPALLEPGIRTGGYRRGTTTLLTTPDGASRVSVEDLAVAVLDELEIPGRDKHFTVGCQSSLAFRPALLRYRVTDEDRRGRFGRADPPRDSPAPDLVELVRGTGHAAVVVSHAAGFLVKDVGCGLIPEAFALLEESVCDATGIDRITSDVLGPRMDASEVP
ncbi:hypothetical protein ACFV2H_43510 [Streptomyces sp. NPDC059629]|uniref:hypothetical protein n=1 Tax=Streptomyces sp. NPDC059629 TaxID=3346889 RepID=UPI0036CAEE13